MRFHISCKGDPSVGISPSQVTLNWPELEEYSLNDANERQIFIDFVKQNLQQCFVKIWDDKSTVVMSDKEFEIYTKEDG